MLAEPHGLRIAVDGQVVNRERLHRAFLRQLREAGNREDLTLARRQCAARAVNEAGAGEFRAISSRNPVGDTSRSRHAPRASSIALLAIGSVWRESLVDGLAAFGGNRFARSALRASFRERSCWSGSPKRLQRLPRYFDIQAREFLQSRVRDRAVSERVRPRNEHVRVHRSIYGRSASKPHRAQHVLEQHLEEEYGGDAAEQQAHEIGVAKFIAEANG